MSSSGRQIADLRSGEAEVLPLEPSDDPSLGRVKIWATNDAENGLELKFKIRGRHATLRDADNTIAFIAQEVGDPGNDVQVELLTAEAGEDLTASYNRYLKRVTVKLRTTAADVAATATTDEETAPYAGDHDLVFTAKTPGAAGNGLEVVVNELGDGAVASTTAAQIDASIEVTLKQGAKTRATLHDTTNKIIYTARHNGASGNSAAWGPDAGYYIVQFGDGVVPQEIYATARWNVNYGAGTTVQQLIDAINAYADESNADHFVTAALAPGGDASAAVQNFGGNGPNQALLTGGADPVLTDHASAVKAAIEADAGSNALVAVTYAKAGGTGAGVFHSSDSGWALSGGVDGDTDLTTNDELKTLLDAMPDVAKVLATKLLTDAGTPVGPIAVSNLAGGDSADVFVGQLFSD